MPQVIQSFFTCYKFYIIFHMLQVYSFYKPILSLYTIDRIVHRLGCLCHCTHDLAAYFVGLNIILLFVKYSLFVMHSLFIIKIYLLHILYSLSTTRFPLTYYLVDLY